MLCLLLVLSGLQGKAFGATIAIEIDTTAYVEPRLELVSNYLEKLLEQRSHGRIQVGRVSIDDEVRSGDPLQDIEDNKRRFAIIPANRLSELEPLLKVYEFPFLFRDSDHKHRTIDLNVGWELLSDHFNDRFRILTIWDNNMNHLLRSNTSSPSGSSEEDSEDQALNRVLHSVLPCRLIDSQEVPINWEETTMESAIARPASADDSTLFRTGHSMTAGVLMTSRSLWQSLPADLQIIVMDAVKDATTYARELALQSDQDALGKLMKQRRQQVRNYPADQYRKSRMAALEFYRRHCTAKQNELIDKIISVE